MPYILATGIIGLLTEHGQRLIELIGNLLLRLIARSVHRLKADRFAALRQICIRERKYLMV